MSCQHGKEVPMIPIPGFPDYYVDGSDIINIKFGKRRVLKQTINNHGYKNVGLCVSGKQTTCKVHRLIAQAYLSDYSEDLDVDHEDRCKTNNDISNLRMATDEENCQNKDCTGYYYHKPSGKYLAQIMVNGKREYIGRYKTEEEAREAYIAEKLKLHPFYTHQENT